jgi:hypothetical protein
MPTPPATSCLPADTWPHQRPNALAETGRASTFAQQLERIDSDTASLLDDLDHLLTTPDSPVSIGDDGQLHLQRLPAETVPDQVLDHGQ